MLFRKPPASAAEALRPLTSILDDLKTVAETHTTLWAGSLSRIEDARAEFAAIEHNETLAAARSDQEAGLANRLFDHLSNMLGGDGQRLNTAPAVEAPDDAPEAV